MTKTYSWLLIVTSALLGACGTQVVGGGAYDLTGAGGETSSGGPGSSGGAGGGGTTPVVTTPAVAMTRATLDQLWDQYWQTHDPSGSSSSGGSGPALDPNDLFLQFADVGETCTSPTADIPCGGHWEVSIALPVSYQKAGVYDLEDPALVAYSYMSETGPLNSPAPDDCSFGGGSLGSGTIEVVSIDATEVHFRLSMTETFWNSDPSGDYVAPRCQ